MLDHPKKNFVVHTLNFGVIAIKRDFFLLQEFTK